MFRTLTITTLLFAATVSVEAAPTLVVPALSGNPGDTTGWGFTITNDTNFLLVTSAAYCAPPAGPGCNASPIGSFSDIITSINFTVVGPGPLPQVSPYSELYSPGVSGVGSFAINPGATPGTVELGRIVLTYELYSVNPNDPTFNPDDDLISTANLLIADTSITVTSVPEPATIALSGIALLALGIRKRRV